MKSTQRETRYEHESVVAIVYESEPPGATEATEKHFSLKIYNKKAVGSVESSWRGDVIQADHLAEMLRELHPVLHPRSDRSPAPSAPLTLNGAESKSPPDSDPFVGLSAEPPNPGEDEILVKMTLDRYRELLDASNEVIRLHVSGKAMALAQLVNRAFGGESAGDLETGVHPDFR
jgi:hypothetical protein